MSVSNSRYAVQFLDLTSTKHDFLPKRPIWKCLSPYVFCAVIAANLGCDIITVEGRIPD